MNYLDNQLQWLIAQLIVEAIVHKAVTVGTSVAQTQSTLCAVPRRVVSVVFPAATFLCLPWEMLWMLSFA